MDSLDFNRLDKSLMNTTGKILSTSSIDSIPSPIHLPLPCLNFSNDLHLLSLNESASRIFGVDAVPGTLAEWFFATDSTEEGREEAGSEELRSKFSTHINYWKELTSTTRSYGQGLALDYYASSTSSIRQHFQAEVIIQSLVAPSSGYSILFLRDLTIADPNEIFAECSQCLQPLQLIPDHSSKKLPQLPPSIASHYYPLEPRTLVEGEIDPGDAERPGEEYKSGAGYYFASKTVDDMVEPTENRYRDIIDNLPMVSFLYSFSLYCLVLAC